MQKFSIVIPVYNERDSIKELYAEIAAACPDYDNYEIIFVDDGSDDGTKDLVLPAQPSARILHTQHQGKAAALNTGITSAANQIIITMDGDLQDNPADIPKFITALNSGYDLVCGWRIARQAQLHQKVASWLYNIAMSALARQRLRDFNCGYKIFKKELYKPSNHRLFTLETIRAGYKVTEIRTLNRSRKYGVSKYGLKKYPEFFSELLLYVLKP